MNTANGLNYRTAFFIISNFNTNDSMAGQCSRLMVRYKKWQSHISSYFRLISNLYISHKFILLVQYFDT
jgi:hypothetical protein